MTALTTQDFVEASWLRSQRDHYRKVPSTLYYTGARSQLRYLFDVSRLFLREEDGAIVAYCLAQRLKDTLFIHALYVRYAHRRQGLARELLEDVCAKLGGSRLVYTCRAHRGARDWAQRLGAEQEQIIR